jgi:signal transduction histidine kinase
VGLHRERGLDGGAALIRRALLPLLLAVLGLTGAGLATLSLHRAASSALQRATEERLRGAGTTAARTLEQPGFIPDGSWLRSVVEANELEGALLLDARLHVVLDPTGTVDRPVDLLRVDATRVRRALAGEPSLSLGWAIGEARVASTYLPVRRGGTVDRVLVLEGGEAYAARQADLDRALHLGWLLSACAGVLTGLVAAGWAAAERRQRDLATRAARGAAVAQVAATVAHEVRNPLGVIRGTVELMAERGRGRLSERDIEAMADILGEVARLRRLTDDFLDLSSDRPLAGVDIELSSFLEDAARASQAATGVEVDTESPDGLHVLGDGGRLRQVLLNLVANAARAGAKQVRFRAAIEGARIRLDVADDGPGIPEDIRPRLFEPFATTRKDGNGLGLAVSRRIVERHGGSLALLPASPGATFRIELPCAQEAG